MKESQKFDYTAFSATLNAIIPDSLKTLNDPIQSSSLSKVLAGLGIVEDGFGTKSLYEWKNGQVEGEPGILFGMRFLPVDEVAFYLARINGIRRSSDLNIKHRIPLFSDFGGNCITIYLDANDEDSIGKIYVEGRDYESRVLLSNSLDDFMSWFQNCLKHGNYVYTDHGHGFGELNLRIPPSTHMLDVLDQLPIPLS